MKIFFRNFGRALANVIDVFDPDIVVLGGGVSKFDALYKKGVAEVANSFSAIRWKHPSSKISWAIPPESSARR